MEELFYNQINQSLKPIEFKWRLINQFRCEIKLAINSYIFFNTVYKDHSSLGQRLLNLKLTNAQTGQSINKWQAYLYYIFSVVMPYSKERFNLLNYKYFDYLEDIYKGLKLLNFLLFINRGKYPCLWHRLLSLDLSLIEGKNRVNIDYFLIYQDLIWSSVSNTLTYLIQLIDVRKIKSLFWMHVSSKWIPVKVRESCLESARQLNDIKRCTICEGFPNNPHQIGCKHVFCYYCLFTDYLSSGNKAYKCPECAYLIKDSNSIRQLFMRTFL